MSELFVVGECLLVEFINDTVVCKSNTSSNAESNFKVVC